MGCARRVRAQGERDTPISPTRAAAALSHSHSTTQTAVKCMNRSKGRTRTQPHNRDTPKMSGTVFHGRSCHHPRRDDRTVLMCNGRPHLGVHSIGGFKRSLHFGGRASIVNQHGEDSFVHSRVPLVHPLARLVVPATITSRARTTAATCTE